MGDWDPERIRALMQAAGMAYGAPTDATAPPPDAAHLMLNADVPIGPPPPADADAPPPGVTPSVWASLSPQGRAEALQRLGGGGSPPPAAPPPTPQNGPPGGKGVIGTGLEMVPALNLLDANRNDGVMFDESGGGLVPKNGPSGFMGRGAVGAVTTPNPAVGTGPSPDAKQPVTFTGGGGASSSSGPMGLGAPQYATIPGHDVPQVSPETRDMLMAGPKAELGAVNAQANADQAKVDAAQQAAMQRAQAYDDLVSQGAMREAHRQSVLRQQEDDMDRVADQVARTQIDPDHLWKNKNAGQLVAGWVAAVLAGYKSGKFGGPNEVLQRMDQEVDRDIAAQKANYEIKRGKLTDLRTLYGQKMARFQDERTAEAAAKADMLSSVLARGDAMAANADSDQVTANWAKARAGIANKLGALKTTMDRWQPTQTVQVGGAAAMGAGTVEGQPINIGDGKFLIANGPVAPELAKKIAAAGAIQTGLQRLAQLYKQRGAGDKLGGDQSAINQQINQELANIAQQRTVFAGQGAMSEGDKKVADTANGVLTGLANFTGDPAQLVNQAIRDVADQKDQYARAIGGRVYRNAGTTRTSKGEIKEQWIPTPEFYGDATAATATPPASVKMDGK